MTIEQLKEQLEKGEITQEQYDAEVKKLEEANNQNNNNGVMTEEQIKKMIQQSEDRVRREYSDKLKAAEAEAEKLRKEKMSEEERAKYETEKLKKELEEKAAEITRREVALHTVDELRAKELPLEFRDILVGSSIDETNERIKAFADQWQKALKDAVDARFKSGANEPGKGKGSDSGTVNPWKDDAFNLTKQAQIMKENPELAKQLASSAGKTLYI